VKYFVFFINFLGIAGNVIKSDSILLYLAVFQRTGRLISIILKANEMIKNQVKVYLTKS
jgi:hypothetical protein